MKSIDVPKCVAHVDETGVRLPGGKRVYGMAAVLTSEAEHVEIARTLLSLLLPGRSYLHHYDETSDRRLLIAKVISELPLDGALIMTETTTDQAQERARARLLSALLPRLQYEEHVDRVVLESRSGSDKHDRRTRDRLRRSRRISTGLQVDHVHKTATPLVWLPDFVAGAYVAAYHHGQPEPWSVIMASHLVDVVRLS